MGHGVDLGAAGADVCRSRAGYWQSRKDIWSRWIAGKEISFESSLVKSRPAADEKNSWRDFVMHTDRQIT
jgi:hypothetical protein